MQVRAILDRLFTLLLLALPLSAAIAMAGPADDEEESTSHREVVIDLVINGEKYHITNLDELKEHADKLSEYVDIDQLTTAFSGEDGIAKIHVLGGKDSKVNVNVQKRVFLRGDGNTAVQLEGPGGVWIANGRNEKLGKFMIGLACKVADESLKSQLGLEAGALVVIEPVSGTPAEKAGFQAHDVLVEADGGELIDLVALIKAVETAGDEDRELEIRIIRKGDTQKLTVKPQKRPDHPKWKILLKAEVNEEHGEDAAHELVVVAEVDSDEDEDESEDLQAMIEELRAELEKMKKDLKGKE